MFNSPIHDALSPSITISLVLFICACNCGNNTAEYPDIIPKLTVNINGATATQI